MTTNEQDPLGRLPDLSQPTLEGLGISTCPEVEGYEILSVLGEGGMGVVYLARQKPPLQRQVALKIVKPGMDSKQVVARFDAERQALALLNHPNIAHVYDAGTTKDAHPYFVMEYVNGPSLIEFCDQHKLSLEERLDLFIQVCDGLQHAHERGILHRDIKPSNILVCTEGDKPVPKIIDFGVAKALTSSLTDRTLVTEQDQLLGTPEYMSPEQAEMRNQDLDTRSDVYSLGAVLYEFLIGVPPFDAKSLREGGIDHIRRTIRDEDPKTPSTRLSTLGEQEVQKISQQRGSEAVALTRHLHKELEWIPLKAMRKERADRYPSALALAEDIQRYLAGARLAAGPASVPYRLRKFTKRHRAIILAISAAAAAVAIGIGVGTTMRSETQRALEALATPQTDAQLAAAGTDGIVPLGAAIHLSDTGWSRPVGTWDPATKTAILTHDVNETIQIDSNGIILDGNGHKVAGPGGGTSRGGVVLAGRTGVTVKNLNIMGFGNEILLSNSTGNTLTANTCTSSRWAGIQVNNSSNGNNVTGNTCNSNSIGIAVDNSAGNTVTGNASSSNREDGIVVGNSSTKNTLTGNICESNNWAGIRLINSTGNMLISNTAKSSIECGIVLGNSNGNSLTTNICESNTWMGIILNNSAGNNLIGNTCQSNQGAGIKLGQSSSNTLTSNTISKNCDGIWLTSYSSNNALEDNNIELNNCNGINMEDSTGNRLTGNTCSSNNNGDGIRLYNSGSNTLEGNTCNSNINNSGIVVDNSSGNTIGSNICETNRQFGIELANSNGNILTSNRCNSNNVDGIKLNNSGNNELTDNTNDSNGGAGIILDSSNDNSLTCNSNSSNVLFGINLFNSTGNTLTSNTCKLNHAHGILLQNNCADNTLANNTTNSNSNDGIQIRYSSGNKLIGNLSELNGASGIWMDHSFTGNGLTGNTALENGHGIGLGNCANCTLTSNTCTSNRSHGIRLISSSSSNTLTDNTISNNGTGIGIYDNSSGNRVYNNDFIDNTTQVSVSGGSGNIFNLDKARGGNYWSDCTGLDADGDGIVDSPYAFKYGQDNLPWTVRDGWASKAGPTIQSAFTTRPAGDARPDPNLVCWWKLDEGSGVTAYDSSGHGNDGVLYGGPQWIAGKIGGALHFDGVDDGIDCPNSASLDVTGPITLAAWVKTEDSGDGKTHEYIVKGHRAYALRHQQDNVMEFMIFDGLSFYNARCRVNDSFNRIWHHLAGIYDRHQLRLYIDGWLQASSNHMDSPHVGSIASSIVHVGIGCNMVDPSLHFIGAIDDARIYNRALTDTEVAHLARTAVNDSDPAAASDPNRFTVWDPNLVGSWK